MAKHHVSEGENGPEFRLAEEDKKELVFVASSGLMVGSNVFAVGEQTGRGNGMRRVHQQACTAALPTDACRITRTPRSHGSSKSQTINSPRFGSVLNAQTVRSAGL